MLGMSLTKNSSESVSSARSAAPLQQHRHQQSPHRRVVQQPTGRRIFASGDFDDLVAAAKQWHSEPPPVVAAVAYQPLAGVPTYSGCVKSIPCAVRLRKVDSDSWDRLSQTLSLPLSSEEANLNSSTNSSGDNNNWWWRIEPLPGCRPLSSVSNASSLSAAALSPPLSAFSVGLDDDSAIALSESATAALDEKIERLVRARAALPAAVSELAPYAGAAKTIPTALPPSLASLHSQSPQHKQQLQQQPIASTLMSMPMHLLDGVEEVEEVDDGDEMMMVASAASVDPDADGDPFAKLKPRVNDGCPPGIALAAYPQPIGYAADAAGMRLLPVRLSTPDESRRRRLLAERAALEAATDAAAAKASDAKRPRELVPYAGWTLLEVEEAVADAEVEHDDVHGNVNDDDDAEAPRAHPEPERYQPLTQLTPYAGGEKILPGIAYSPFLVRRQQRQPRRQRRRRLSIVERPIGDCRIDETDLDQRIYMLLPDILFDELKDLLPTLITVSSADGRAPLPPTLSSTSSKSSIPMSTLARHRSARPPLCDTVRQNGLEMALLRIGDLAFACDLRCPHAGGPMNFGQLISDYNGDCLLRCPWHGYTFNLFADGEIHSPSSRRDLRLRMYPVRRDRLGRLYIGFAELNKLWFSRAAPDELF